MSQIYRAELPAEYKSRFEKEGPIEVNGETIETYKPISNGEATNVPITKSKITDENNVIKAINKRWKDVQSGKFSNKEM